jgi:hypothetical protein
MDVNLIFGLSENRLLKKKKKLNLSECHLLKRRYSHVSNMHVFQNLSESPLLKRRNLHFFFLNICASRLLEKGHLQFKIYIYIYILCESRLSKDDFYIFLNFTECRFFKRRHLIDLASKYDLFKR